MDVSEVATAAEFGAAIRRLRKRRGWTQVELAEWLAVNPVTVRRLERGFPVAMTTALRAMSILGGKAVVAPRTHAIVAAGYGPDDG